MIELEKYFDGTKSNTYKNGDIFDIANLKVVLLETATYNFAVFDTITWNKGCTKTFHGNITLEDIQGMLPQSLSNTKAVPHKWAPNSIQRGRILQNIDTCDIYMLTKHNGCFALTNLSTGVAIDGDLYAPEHHPQEMLTKSEWLKWNPLESELKYWKIADEPIAIG